MSKNINRFINLFTVSLQALVLAVIFVVVHSTTSVGALDTYTVHGTVSDQNTTPVAGVSVVAVSVEDPEVVSEPAVTAEDGTYSLQVVAGTYDVQFTAPGGSYLQSATSPGVVVADDQTVDMQLAPVTHTFSGTVTANGSTPLANLQVALLDDTGQIARGVATTDAEGHFVVVAPAAVYTYLVITDGDVLDGVHVANIHIGNAGDVSLDLTNSDVVSDIVLPLAKLTLVGKDGAGQLAAGASFTVAASNAGTATVAVGGESKLFTINFANDSGTLDASGSYSGWVVSGTTFTPDSYSLCIQFTTTVRQCEDDTVVVGSDTTVEVDEPLTHTFSGTVTDASSMPVPNLNVALLDETGQVLLAVATTDESGNFSMVLPAGVYSWVQLAGGDLFNGSKVANISLGNAYDDTLDLSSGDVTRNYTVNLVRLKVIAKDADGNVMPGAAYSLAANNSGSTPVATNSTPGSFTIFAVGDGGTVGEDGSVTLYVAQGTSFSAETGLVCVTFVDATSACTTDPVNVSEDLTLTLQEGQAPLVTAGV